MGYLYLPELMCGALKYVSLGLLSTLAANISRVETSEDAMNIKIFI